MSNGAWDDITDTQAEQDQYEAEDELYGATGPIDEETLEDELSAEQAAREECGCDGCLFRGPCQARRVS